MGILIRPAGHQDIPSMYAISQRAHMSPYYDALIPKTSREEYERHYEESDDNRQRFEKKIRDKIENPEWFLVVAEEVDGVVGYTLAHHEEDGALTLKGLFVDPSVQGRGVGGALFAHSLTWQKPGGKVRLLVISANTIAKSIYKKHGFSVIGQSDVSFFGASQDVMECRIIRT